MFFTFFTNPDLICRFRGTLARYEWYGLLLQPFSFYNPLIGFTQLLHLFGDMAEIHIILFLILQQTLLLYLQLSQFSPHSLLSVNLPSS